jgi:hypothetical protein
MREGVDEATTLADVLADEEIFSAYADDLVGDLADRMAVADSASQPR